MNTIKTQILRIVVIIIAAITTIQLSAQDYTISTNYLYWEHNDKSTKSVYINNRDSLSMTLVATGCSHFSVTPQAGLWRIDVAPMTFNTGNPEITEYFSLVIDDWGTIVTETITLRHQGQEYSISTNPSELAWTYDDTESKAITVNAGASWCIIQDGDGFCVNPISGGSGITSVYVTPSGYNEENGVKRATLHFNCGQVTRNVQLSQTPNPAISDLSPGNYIQTMTYTAPGSNTYVRDVTYYDGFGYPVQTLAVAGSPRDKTIVNQKEYDIIHRPDSVSYLPYVRINGGANYVPKDSSIVSQHNWYITNYEDYTAHRKCNYETSPYGRAVSVQKEGDSWMGDAGGPIKTNIQHGYNASADSVMHFMVNPANQQIASCIGNWLEGTLVKKRIVDECGSVTDTYMDANGNTICIRSFSGAGTTGMMSETYFIYDIRGNLSLVIQPEGAALLKSTSAPNRTIVFEDSITNTNSNIYKEYCFYNNYDGWGNLLTKHVPGGGTTRYIYDARNRLVLRTNDLMSETDINDPEKAQPRYVYTQYDNYDRVVSCSVISTSFPLDSLSSHCSASSNVPTAISTVFSTVCPLYSATYFPFGAISDVMTGFIADDGVITVSDVETNNIKGLLRSETLYPAANADGTAPAAGGLSRTRRYYYDYLGRIVQVKETDGDGWSARYSTKYDFVGNVVKSKETHVDPDTGYHSLLTEYAYDDRGRRESIWRDIDGETQTVVFYYYDELGRLSQKVFGDGPGEVGTEDYSYDLHGWMTGMEARKDWGMTTLLSETLRYASPQKPGTAARFDGNISEITYASYSGGSTPSSDTYGYTYDGLKRLTDAAHYTGASTTSDNLKTEKNIAYDRNGNLTGLNRYGSLGLEGMLSLTHTGNRLTGMQVWDGTNLPSSDTVTYDAMGNLVTDTRKGLQFCYNFANLPRKVEGMAGSANAGLTLSYGYLSDGTKTSALLSSVSGAVDGLKYRGSFVYEVSGSSERLNSVSWDEGRIAIDYSQNASNPYIRDEWHVRDHLGNTRMVVNLTDYGTVIEKNEYLPFGTRIANPLQSASNRYRLAGKEEQRFGGLDLALSDFGARYYDPFSARWTTRDPLAGKYPVLSPYNYCAGNPVNYIDPIGLSTHTDSLGVVIAVYNDGDNGVYRHLIDSNTYDGSQLHSSDGKWMGESLFWDEFINPITGKILENYPIDFGESFDPLITRLSAIADGLDLSIIALLSIPGGAFDVKSKEGRVGKTLKGFYATSRSAGNYLAGFNAAKGTFLGNRIDFTTFQKLAGSLHQRGNNPFAAMMVLYKGEAYGKAPTYGEIPYQYRMSLNGWKDGTVYYYIKQAIEK